VLRQELLDLPAHIRKRVVLTHPPDLLANANEMTGFVWVRRNGRDLARLENALGKLNTPSTRTVGDALDKLTETDPDDEDRDQ
jgi:hypothetical protein